MNIFSYLPTAPSMSTEVKTEDTEDGDWKVGEEDEAVYNQSGEKGW